MQAKAHRYETRPSSTTIAHYCVWFGIVVSVLLASTDAKTQTAPDDLQRLRGPWVPERAKCDAVFFRQGTSINFHRPSASVREGILIHGNRIEDARNRCLIQRVKADGDARTLLVTCFSGLIVSHLSFLVRFVDEDTVIRSPADFPEEQLRLRRCKI